jgi:hypothetical protein
MFLMRKKKKRGRAALFIGKPEWRDFTPPPHNQPQWNCSSSVEPVSAVTLDFPPCMAVVTSSK